MKIYPSVRQILANDVISKWEKITKNSRDSVMKTDFLSIKINGKPQTSKTRKDNWTIRDCILNDKNALKYIESNNNFRGKNLQEKIEKYNGYKFYQNIYLESAECSNYYLETYARFIGYSSFKEFTEKREGIKLEDKTSQLEIINEYDSKENRTLDLITTKPKRNYDIPYHILGQFVGYFIRPRKPVIASNELFTMLTLLICDNNIVYVRTTSSQLEDNDLDKKYYEGICYSTNNDTLHMSFSIMDNESNTYEFSFVFDIQSRKIKPNFNDNKHLYGIYAGSDVTTKKPTAGRLIIEQKHNWVDLIKTYFNRTEIITKFLSDDKYKPYDISKKLPELFDQKPDKPNIIRNFFTLEERYIEDISIIREYVRSPKKYESIAGEYSIYSLSSTALEIKRGIAKITNYGEIEIKGSKLANEVKRFHGWANVLKNNVIAITLNRQVGNRDTEDDEMIFYMLKLNQPNSQGKYDLINGTRIMATNDGSNLPFSGRVVFVRENDNFFDEHDSLITIKLFEEQHGSNLNNLNLFRRLKNRAVYNLLVGFENNLVKTFGAKREKVGFTRNINYADNFFNLAKYHAKNKTGDTYELAIINLYYSLLHGRENLKKQIEDEPDFNKFKTDKYVLKAIKYTDKIIVFNEIEIEKIKLTLLTLSENF